jgi:hypothetical protein
VPAFFIVGKEKKKMDIRSENEKGKLLFKWDPDTNIVSISCRDAIYDVKLIRSPNNSSYRVVNKYSKQSARDSPGETDIIKHMRKKL